MLSALHRQSSDEPVLLAEFACARCWKQKKRCDKVSPRCGRCTKQAAACRFSAQPPNACVVAVESVKSVPIVHASAPFGDPGSIFQAIQPNHMAKFAYVGHFAKLEFRFPDQPPCNKFDGWFAAKLNSVMAANCTDIESVCKVYFKTFNESLPIMTEAEFWRRFFLTQRGSDPAFTALLLSMYIIALPIIADFGTETSFNELVYSTVKSAWSVFQNTNSPSITLIQTGLLLASYEHGQSLEEISRLTASACARMGYAMGLHKTLRQDTEVGFSEKIPLETGRRVWWAIIALERLLFLRNVEGGYSFVSQDPALDDYLPPSDHKGMPFTDILGSSVVGVVRKLPFGHLNITFADVTPYPALAQSSYLLSQVAEYIKKGGASGSETQRVEAIYLDQSLQAFAISLLRQAEGRSLTGNYCTAFFMCVFSLIALHQHDMFFNGALDASHAIDPSSRHFLAMQVLTRMLRDIAVTLTAKDANVHLMPPFEIYVVYLSIVLHIKVGDRGNSEDWKAELQHIVDYLRVLQKKWKSARVYLDKVLAMQRTIIGPEQQHIDIDLTT